MEIMKNIKDFLNIVPTEEQKIALNKVATFVDPTSDDDFMIIQGSAGTGKSTIVKTITEYLTNQEIKFSLSAPTGKAAKVIQKKTAHVAKTLHSLIYKPEKAKHGCGVKLIRKQNLIENYTIFIVDEASMISDVVGYSEKFLVSKPLLTDLIDFVKQGNKKNKLLFIGDKFQLPPVNCQDSPALSVKYLINEKKLRGAMVELTEVKRQDGDSYILKNATNLRVAIQNGAKAPELNIQVLTNSTSALYKFIDLYDKESYSKVVVLAWRNNDVNFFNEALRQMMGLGNNVLCGNDQVTFHTNWMHNQRLVMKGENATILESESGIETYAGLNFMNVKIQYQDSNGELVLAYSKVLIESLNSFDGNLSLEQENALAHESNKRNPVYRESQTAADDPYVGSLRLRYGYAITCHKAQGGEWDNVILHPWLPKEDLRWQYTAVTRASKDLFTYQCKYQKAA